MAPSSGDAPSAAEVSTPDCVMDCTLEAVLCVCLASDFLPTSYKEHEPRFRAITGASSHDILFIHYQKNS
jgi:hypothetical protein